MSAKENEENEKSTKIRVVGIGTSAGGLEALQEFFKAVNPKSGLAYVVIQHLSPDYKSLMDELLARYTTMPIKVIENGVKLQIDTVYLIPPRKNLSIKDDKLFLHEVDSNKGLNLPIDIFFRSLADEKGKDAICIILSGTGSDGTAGVKAIKEKNGMIMAQDETSAKFAGMPISAVSTGFVDYVLRPDEMPEQIISYIQHPLINKSLKKQDIVDDDLDALTKAILIIKEKFNVDFGSYRENTLLRRLERRVSINKFNNLDLYVNYLDSSENEKDILFRELLIGVTQFFRDKDAFNSLNENVIHRIVTSGKKSIRIWSAGCSTGEEVYSIAIAFKEQCTKLNIDLDIKIFATDIDRRALDIASTGIYPESILLDVDPQLVAKYFKKKDNFYKINEEVRNLIVFASHNLLKDPPFSKLDLLICRNLFIYIKPEIQNRLLVMFYYSLQPGGYLFMGISESLGEMNKAFKVVDAKNKIFEFIPGYKPPILSNVSLHENKILGINTELYLKRKDKNQVKTEEFFGYLLNEFAPPSIIVDNNNQIISIINDINPFSEIQNGVYSNELFSILPKDIALFINNILRELKKEGKFIVSRNLTGIEKRGHQSVNVTGRKIVMPVNTYYMFSFEYIETVMTKKKGKKEQVDISTEKEERIA